MPHHLTKTLTRVICQTFIFPTWRKLNGWWKPSDGLPNLLTGVAKAANGSPFPTYSYTLNFTEATTFPNVVVCGLTPVACKGLFDLVVDVVAAGNSIEIGTELLGLFDGEQRARFISVDMNEWGHLFATATSWYKAKPFLWCSCYGPTAMDFCQVKWASISASRLLSRSWGRHAFR